MRVCASTPSSSPGGTRGQVASTSGILTAQSSTVAGKTALVEPPKPDPNSLPSRDPRGEVKPNHTNWLSQEDDRRLRPVPKSSKKITKVVGLDETLPSKAWRSL
jgi:hypothetical protein